MKEEKEPYPLFAANLIVKDRPCLVVGGGPVARRKTKSLLEAEAEVTVVSPETCDEILMLAEEEIITHNSRDFEESDTEGMFLVFAATDNEEVNLAVMQACNKRNIFCCTVDGNWRDGDFVSPASFSKDGVTVSVSTGGQSCTRARDIKNLIKESLDNLPQQED